MPIDFTAHRWERIKQNSRLWWAGELDRPLIPAAVTGRDPGRAEPKLPRQHRTAAYDFAVPAAEVVDRWDYDLSCREFLGDGFPWVWPDFGPGALAAFLGSNTTVDRNTVWFGAPDDREIADIHFVYRPDHPWLRRVGDIMRAAIDRWGGSVQVSMTDLGGALDILSTFRPGEKLLLDLHDHPDEVERLSWEAHEAWWRAYDELNAILQPANPGYSAWAGIFSPEPSYMLQCDFCYMIGPAMFDAFVKPELAATCRRLVNPFYHLDGVGQLPHLDSLLTIAELKGVQWVPGDGQPPCGQWPEVYEKIRRAGRLVQFIGSLDGLDRVVDRLGTAKGITTMPQVVGPEGRDDLLRRLERYGAA